MILWFNIDLHLLLSINLRFNSIVWKKQNNGLLFCDTNIQFFDENRSNYQLMEILAMNRTYKSICQSYISIYRVNKYRKHIDKYRLKVWRSTEIIYRYIEVDNTYRYMESYRSIYRYIHFNLQINSVKIVAS